MEHSASPCLPEGWRRRAFLCILNMHKQTARWNIRLPPVPFMFSLPRAFLDSCCFVCPSQGCKEKIGCCSSDWLCGIMRCVWVAVIELRIEEGPSHLMPGLGCKEGKQRAMRGAVSMPDGAVQSVGTQRQFCSLECLESSQRMLVLATKRDSL